MGFEQINLISVGKSEWNATGSSPSQPDSFCQYGLHCTSVLSLTRSLLQRTDQLPMQTG